MRFHARVALCTLALLSVPAFAAAENSEAASPQATSPAAVASPVPLRNPLQVRPKRKRISWSVSPDLQYETESNLSPKGPFSLSRVGWHIGYDILPRLSAYWTRGNIDSQFARVFVKGKPVFSAPGFDLTDEIGLSYAVTPNFSVSAGSYRRWRQTSPGAGDPTNNNPIQLHGPFVSLSDRFGPDTYIGKPFSVNLLAVYVDHHLNQGALATLAPGTVNHGSQWTLNTAIATLRIPIAHQRRFVPSLSYIYFDTYFDNSPVPTINNAVQYGVTITGSPLVDYSIMARTFTEHNEGTPFPFPQTQHYSWIQLTANFHGRL